MKRWLVLLMIATMSLSLVACGESKDKEKAEDKPVVSETVEPEVTEEDLKEEGKSEEDTDAEVTMEVTAEVTVEVTKEEQKEESDEVEETVAEDDNSEAKNDSEKTGKWVNLDDMHFFVNGKKYTLNKTTLQEMIDDGVPFNENDLANAGNNLNKNSSSQGFRINLAEYWTAQVYVGNYTDENTTIKDLPICEVYLPINDKYSQDILEFEFPLDLTEEELIKNAGEPTELKVYDSNPEFLNKNYLYEKESTKYYGSYGYKFEFTNGNLEYFKMEYMP